MSSPALATAVPAAKTPPFGLYGLVIILLGLAIIFLINRVKSIDQRQRMQEIQSQQTVKDEDVKDLVYEYLSNPDNVVSVQQILTPHIIAVLDSCAPPAPTKQDDEKEVEPEITVTEPPPKKDT